MKTKEASPTVFTESHSSGTHPIREFCKSDDKVGRFISRFLNGKVIMNCERNPYLYRWYVIRTSRLGVFIHRFVRSDEDRALHDHPWAFIVIPIWRGYREHNDRGVTRVLPILGTRMRKATYRPRVELIDGRQAWSLFFRFRYVRLWGFWPKAGFVDWKKMVERSLRGLTPCSVRSGM